MVISYINAIEETLINQTVKTKTPSLQTSSSGNTEPKTKKTKMVMLKKGRDRIGFIKKRFNKAPWLKKKPGDTAAASATVGADAIPPDVSPTQEDEARDEDNNSNDISSAAVEYTAPTQGGEEEEGREGAPSADTLAPEFEQTTSKMEKHQRSLTPLKINAFDGEEEEMNSLDNEEKEEDDDKDDISVEEDKDKDNAVSFRSFKKKFGTSASVLNTHLLCAGTSLSGDKAGDNEKSTKVKKNDMCTLSSSTLLETWCSFVEEVGDLVCHQVRRCWRHGVCSCGTDKYLSCGSIGNTLSELCTNNDSTNNDDGLQSLASENAGLKDRIRKLNNEISAPRARLALLKEKVKEEDDDKVQSEADKTISPRALQQLETEVIDSKQQLVNALTIYQRQVSMALKTATKEELVKQSLAMEEITEEVEADSTQEGEDEEDADDAAKSSGMINSERENMESDRGEYFTFLNSERKNMESDGGEYSSYSGTKASGEVTSASVAESECESLPSYTSSSRSSDEDDTGASSGGTFETLATKGTVIHAYL